MTVKDHNQVSQWNFIMITPDGSEKVVTTEGRVNKLYMLTDIVMSILNVYDGATNGEYSKVQQALAQEKGMEFRDYMMRIIEHQFCLRNAAVPCWNDGAGDIIHGVLSKVDGYIEATPDVIRRKVQGMVARITPSKSKTFRGCAVCGGSTSFNPAEDNLGRAGQLNG